MLPDLYLYLTYETGLQSVSDRSNNLRVRFTKEKRFLLYPGGNLKKALDENDFPEAILILDEIPLHVLSTNLKRLKNKYNIVYLAWHYNGHLRPGAVQKQLPYFTIRDKMGTHLSENKLYMSAVNFIDGDPAAVEKAKKAFRKNDELDMNYKLYAKFQDLLNSKVTWEEEYFIREVTAFVKTIEVAFIDKILEEITFDPDKAKFKQQLLPLEARISTLENKLWE